MNTVPDRPWTAETFLAWEDQQDGKNEFDGRRVIPMAGGSVAHQQIVINLCFALRQRLLGTDYLPIPAMRLRIGQRFRYPDVVVCAGPLDQTIKTVTDATAIFEVASGDTAATDRVIKLREYAEVPSLRCYVLLEQTAVAATLFQRDASGPWIATAHTEGALSLPGLDTAVPLEDLYQGLTFSQPA